MESQLEGSSNHSLPTTSALDHQYGTFVCGDHLFALPVAKVMEVIRFEQKLVKIPQTPDFVLGVFDFRGQGVPLIDIQKMMFDTPSEVDSKGKVVLFTVDGKVLGLYIDRVRDILNTKSTTLSKIQFRQKTGRENLVKNLIHQGNDAAPIYEIAPDLALEIDGLPLIESLYKSQNGTKAVDSLKYISFQVSDVWMAIPLEHVQEITPNQNLIQSDLSLDFAVGLITLRNQPIPVMDLATYLGHNQSRDEASRGPGKVLITPLQRGRLGLLADRLGELQTVPKDDIKPVPRFGNKGQAHLFSGVIFENDKSVLLLRPEVLAKDEDILSMLVETQSSENSNVQGLSDQAATLKDKAHRGTYLKMFFGETVLVSTEDIQELVPYDQSAITTPLGKMKHFEGLLELRGQSIPIYNVESYFGLESDQSSKARVMIVNNNGTRLGMVVRHVDDLVKVSNSDRAGRDSVFLNQVHKKFRDRIQGFVHIEAKNDSSQVGRAMMIYDVKGLLGDMSTTKAG